MSINLKTTFSNHIKNLRGFTTSRKIVVFSVDDFGNVRLASKKARENLKTDGLRIGESRFDNFDGLCNSEDLTNLFETLSSVKDVNSNYAIITAYSNCANIDFDAVISNNYDKYRYEILPVTLNKLSSDNKAWKLWKEGLKMKIFIPQFHGREHVNVKLFNDLLKSKNQLLYSCLNNYSYSSLPLNFSETIKYNEALSFEKINNEIHHLKDILIDGLKIFANIFGYSASNFNSPGATEYRGLHQLLMDNEIRFIDTNFKRREHLGDNKFKTNYIYMGTKNEIGQNYLLRNCIFEPTLYDPDYAINLCLKQIENAFFWNKPANISSHRINFTSIISENNRKIGNDALKKLLLKIVNKWPNVEFMSSNNLGNLIVNNEF